MLYVYEKQLEEADIIVINKSDLLSAEQLDGAASGAGRALSRSAEIVAVGARTGAGPGRTGSRRLSGARWPSRRAMDVDYDVYAEGEALLGWLNATLPLVAARRRSTAIAPAPAPGGRAAAGSSPRADIEIAHFKMTLTPDDRQRPGGAEPGARPTAAPSCRTAGGGARPTAS